MHNVDWNDVRFFLVAAREGSFVRAAHTMKVEHTTVARRVSALEKQLGSPLLERTHTGLRLTPAGQEVLARAAEAEDRMTGIERLAGTLDAGAAGEVLLTTSSVLAQCFVAPALAALRSAHPQITLRVSVSRHFASLPKREADVALRLRPPGAEVAEGEVVARKAGDAYFGLYASRRYIEEHGANLSEPERHRFVRYGSVNWEPGRAWADARFGAARVAVTLEDMPAVRAACEHGVGLAVLPDFYAATTGLVRIVPDCDRAAIYVATHPDVRRVARVAAVVRWLYDTLARILGEVGEPRS
jgi:DNA-binding transcriptional LysR family regulator